MLCSSTIIFNLDELAVDKMAFELYNQFNGFGSPVKSFEDEIL